MYQEFNKSNIRKICEIGLLLILYKKCNFPLRNGIPLVKRKTVWPRKALDSEKGATPDTSRDEDDRMCNRIQRIIGRAN